MGKLLQCAIIDSFKIHSTKRWFTINVLQTMTTEFCYRGRKIRDLLRNWQQNHSSICDTMDICTINLFVFSNLVRMISWPSNRGKFAFFHIKQPACPGNEFLDLNTAWKLNCVANANFTLDKKIKKYMCKESKKKEKVKASLKLPSTYPFSEWLYHQKERRKLRKRHSLELSGC